MANNPKAAVLIRNAALDAAFDVLNSGKLRIYTGTQPADADTALAGNTLLADLALGADAFADAASGSKAANAISDDTSADNTGTAAWGSLLNSSNVRKFDYSAGTASADLILNTTSIVATATVQVSAFTVSQAA